MSKIAKIAITFITVAIVLLLGWWYTHTTWKIKVDCMPINSGRAYTPVDSLLKNLFLLETECGSY